MRPSSASASATRAAPLSAISAPRASGSLRTSLESEACETTSSGPGDGRGPFTQSSLGVPRPGESVSSAVRAVGPSRRTTSP